MVTTRSQSINMVEHADNIPPLNLQNGNEANNIPQPPTMERLYRIICQLQDQNRKLSAQMAAMNRENNRRVNEVAATRIMIIPSKMTKRTTSTTLVGERKPFKWPLPKACWYTWGHFKNSSCLWPSRKISSFPWHWIHMMEPETPSPCDYVQTYNASEWSKRPLSLA